MRFILLILLTAVASLIPTQWTLADDSLPPFEGRICDKGTVLLSDDFSGSALEKGWTAAKGKWEVADGILKGVEKPEDHHAAVVRHPLKAHDMIVQFSFRFDGAKMVALSLNNAKGHVCRVVITPALVSINKDKPSQDSKDNAAVIAKEKVEIKPGEWHTMLVTVCGKSMIAELDGKRLAAGTNDAVDVDKTNLGFPTTGEGISLKELRVWEAIPRVIIQKTAEK